jgi:hypothetical protein
VKTWPLGCRAGEHTCRKPLKKLRRGNGRSIGGQDHHHTQPVGHVTTFGNILSFVHHPLGS